jgi:hypothetical protein
MCGWLVGLLGIKSSCLAIFDPIWGFLEILITAGR